MSDEFCLKTADPRFDPTEPVIINGYRFVPVRQADLASLDPIIATLNELAGRSISSMYDDLWNFRNQLVPFAPGDEHFDEECG